MVKCDCVLKLLEAPKYDLQKQVSEARKKMGPWNVTSKPQEQAFDFYMNQLVSKIETFAHPPSDMFKP
jgi:hypothetical protein